MKLRTKWFVLQLAFVATLSIFSELGQAATSPAQNLLEELASLPRTTSGVIYMNNLEASIRAAEQRLSLSSSDPNVYRSLGELHYLRGRIRGDLEELGHALAMFNAALERAPTDPVLYFFRAQQHQTLHKFAEAREDLETALRLGGDQGVFDLLNRELDWEAGRYAKVIPAIRTYGATGTREGLTRLGRLEQDLGNHSEADRLFARAERLVKDVDPLMLATLEFYRGFNQLEANNLELALVHFRESERRLPAYIAAREHAAETLVRLGRTEEAVRAYQDVIRDCNDPEFKGALAELYRQQNQIGLADTLRREASLGFDKLIKTHPEAMYWHASEFFLGEGRDTGKALRLLRANHALRPNAKSLVALARGELVAGSVDKARNAIDAALAMPLVSADLFVVAAEVYARSGDVTKSLEWQQQAYRIDPSLKTIFSR